MGPGPLNSLPAQETAIAILSWTSHCIESCATCRRAQRKFRERQKQKLADSEGKALELKKELEQLRLEKSKLETRNSLLEKLVTMKGGGALTMFSDVDGAVDVQTAQPKQEAFSQVMHLTVKGKPGWPSGRGVTCLPCQVAEGAAWQSVMHEAMACDHIALSIACVAQPNDMLDTMFCFLPMSASLSSCDGMRDA